MAELAPGLDPAGPSRRPSASQFYELGGGTLPVLRGREKVLSALAVTEDHLGAVTVESVVEIVRPSRRWRRLRRLGRSTWRGSCHEAVAQVAELHEPARPACPERERSGVEHCMLGAVAHPDGLGQGESSAAEDTREKVTEVRGTPAAVLPGFTVVLVTLLAVLCLVQPGKSRQQCWEGFLAAEGEGLLGVEVVDAVPIDEMVGVGLLLRPKRRLARREGRGGRQGRREKASQRQQRGHGHQTGLPAPCCDEKNL